MMSSRCIRRRRSGFTLLEVLLATAVMSVIALALYSALRIAFKARDSAMASVSPARSAELAMTIIGQDVESAIWPTGTLAGAFIGGPGQEVSSTDQLEFYAVLPDNPIAATATANNNNGGMPTLGGGPSVLGAVDPTFYAGLCRIDILVRQLPSDAQPVLVRRITRNLLSPNDPVTEDQILCRGVQTFTVSYLDSQQTSYDTWDSTQQGDSLPLCIQVTLQVQSPPPADGSAPAANSSYSTVRVMTFDCYRGAVSGGTL